MCLLQGMLFSVSAKDYYITDFGAKADGVTVNTRIIQSAVDFVSANGGGRIIFTPGGFVSYKTDVAGFLGYLIFPSVAIAIPKISMTVKLLKESILEEYKKEYVRTAYSRGNSTTQVLYKHVLKNALIPVITFLGMTLADIVAGSIVIEQVFGIPGIGRILLTSISNRDFPVVQAIIIILAVIILVINFIVDIIYHKVDPRIDTE